jgi:putative sporulation protein YyaC
LKWPSFPKIPTERNFSPAYRVHVHQPEARELFGFHFKEFLKKEYPLERPLVILCIGTDRSTGDSLGPLIGSKLQAAGSTLFQVYGTLEKPVHAVNLEETTGEIHRRFHRPYIVAVDACLGKAESIGYISIKSGPLQPGTGVNKSLPAVGNLHVVGVVNVGGFMEYLVLQNTRLNLVMQMAEVISDGLLQGCRAFFSGHSPVMAEGKPGLTPVFSE